MRNELNQIERIEKYLRNELNADEKKIFEQELKTNTQLQEQVALQKQVLDGLQTLALKTQAKSSYHKFKWGKNLKKWGSIGGTAFVISAATYFTWNYISTDKNGNANAYELPQYNENGETLWADADKYLPYQRFAINTNADTVIETQDGIVMAIPAGVFLDQNGNPVKGNVELEVKEAIHPNDILKSGLSTKSGNNLLETGGMFYINARIDGKSLKIDPAKGIYTEVPTNEIKPDMQLFEGKRLANGQIDWVNPKPLEKYLVPVDIHSLNFYPPNYEDSLAGMGKDIQNKFYKDSLYYSFANLFGNTYPIESSISKATDSTKKDAVSNQDESSETKNNYYINNNPFGIAFTYENRTIYASKNCKNEREAGQIMNYLKANGFQYSIAHNSDGYFISGFKSKIASPNGKILFEKHCASCHHPNHELVGPALIGAVKRWSDAGVKNEIYNWIKNPKATADKVGYAKNLKAIWDAKNIPLMTAKALSISEIDAIFEYVESCENGINPAKIKAIWDNKYSNTLLATREFEERLQTIHQTCNNAVLDVYVNNLDKKLCTVDSMAAKIAGGYYDTFMKFAARKDGRIKSGEKHLAKLQKYYAEKNKAYTAAVLKTEQEFWKKQNQKAVEFDLATTKQNSKEFERIAKNLKKELDENLNEAYRQLGFPVNTTARTGGARFAVNVVNTGWKNIDAYVTEATVKRTTLDYTDINTGKRDLIEYKELSVSVTDAAQYESIFVYIIPDKLDSYMRLNEKNGHFTEKLNGTFTHEMVCVAYKNNETYYHYMNGIGAGEYNNIKLELTSANELEKQLSRIKQYKHKAAMTEELAYHYLEQKEKARTKKVNDLTIFRSRIQTVIFPCHEPNVALPEVESASVTIDSTKIK